MGAIKIKDIYILFITIFYQYCFELIKFIYFCSKIKESSIHYSLASRSIDFLV